MNSVHRELEIVLSRYTEEQLGQAFMVIEPDGIVSGADLHKLAGRACWQARHHYKARRLETRCF